MILPPIPAGQKEAKEAELGKSTASSIEDSNGVTSKRKTYGMLELW